MIFIAISKCTVRNKCKRVYTDVFKMCFSMKVQLVFRYLWLHFKRSCRIKCFTDQPPPDVQFNHQGYLFLATPEKAEKLEELVKMQK